MKPTRRTLTPRQAGSARSLDRWERVLTACLGDLRAYPLAYRPRIVRVMRRLRALRASVQRAERR